MRITRIYYPGTYHIGDGFLLEDKTAHYLATVLRLKEGDTCHFFNGQSEYRMQIQSVKKKAMEVTCLEWIADEAPPVPALHLGQVISKGDRMDFVMQKAVELGVASITPLSSDHCQMTYEGERAEKRIRHWQEIVNSAAEQSGRIFVPKVLPIQSLASWFLLPGDLKCLFEPGSEKSLKNIEKNPAYQNIRLNIGPEGGFSKRELALAKEAGYLFLHLGPRILRTETAALVALNLMDFIFS